MDIYCIYENNSIECPDNSITKIKILDHGKIIKMDNISLEKHNNSYIIYNNFIETGYIKKIVKWNIIILNLLLIRKVLKNYQKV